MGYTTAITTPDKKTSLLFHASYLKPSSIEGFLTYAKMDGAGSLTASNSESWKRLQTIMDMFNTQLGLTIKELPKDTDFKGGIYVVDDNWQVKEIERPKDYVKNGPDYTFTMPEMLRRINWRMPEAKRHSDADIENATREFYAKLSDDEILERRKDRRTASDRLYDYMPAVYSSKDAVMEAFDNCPGIKEHLDAMGFVDTFEVTGATNVRDFYTEVYPNDEQGQEIDPDVTFRDILFRMAKGENFYDIIGVGDSAVREHTFSYMADAFHVRYGDIYNLWMGERTEGIEKALKVESVLETVMAAEQAEAERSKEKPSDTLDVVVVPVGGEPYQKTLTPDADGSFYPALKECVGGNIDCAGWIFDDEPTIYCNDEGKFTSYPNRAVYATKGMEEAGLISMNTGECVKAGEVLDIIYGDMVAVGFDPETGCDRSITPEETKKVMETFSGQASIQSGVNEVMKIKAEALERRRRKVIAELLDEASGIKNEKDTDPGYEY